MPSRGGLPNAADVGEERGPALETLVGGAVTARQRHPLVDISATPLLTAVRDPSSAAPPPDDTGPVHQGKSRALLAGMAEGGARYVGHRRLEVGGRGNDEGVLTARLGMQAHVRPPAEEAASRVP
jgi:hypothetical protein